MLIIISEMDHRSGSTLVRDSEIHLAQVLCASLSAADLCRCYSSLHLKFILGITKAQECCVKIQIYFHFIFNMFY